MSETRDTTPQMCVKCGIRPAVIGPLGGRNRCEACRTALSTAVMNSVRKRRQRVLQDDPTICRRCLKNPATEGPRGGFTLCDSCRVVNSEQNKRSRLRRMEAR